MPKQVFACNFAIKCFRRMTGLSGMKRGIIDPARTCLVAIKFLSRTRRRGAAKNFAVNDAGMRPNNRRFGRGARWMIF